jgi:hypothetical protein
VSKTERSSAAGSPQQIKKADGAEIGKSRTAAEVGSRITTFAKALPELRKAMAKDGQRAEQALKRPEVKT